jgi:hypothetical protein
MDRTAAQPLVKLRSLRSNPENTPWRAYWKGRYIVKNAQS